MSVEALAAAAESSLLFCDPDSRNEFIAALVGQDRLSPLLAFLASGVERAARRWLRNCGALDVPDGPAHASSLALLRGAASSWAHVLDEAASWAALREVAMSEGVSIPDDSTLLDAARRLRIAEDDTALMFPHFSLCVIWLGAKGGSRFPTLYAFSGSFHPSRKARQMSCSRGAIR